MSRRKFTKGDRVWVKGNSVMECWEPKDKNKRFKGIVRMVGTGGIIDVLLDYKHGYYSFYKYQLSLVKIIKRPKFQVGDKVLVNGFTSEGVLNENGWYKLIAVTKDYLEGKFAGDGSESKFHKLNARRVKSWRKGK